MQTSTVFLVMDFKFDKKDVPCICGAFDDFSSALAHANNLKHEYGIDLNLDIIPAYMMIGTKKEAECRSLDLRKHIAFDISKMEIPVRCDLCKNNASHFCNIHGGIYCFRHILDHEDALLNFNQNDNSSQHENL